MNSKDSSIANVRWQPWCESRTFEMTRIQTTHCQLSEIHIFIINIEYATFFNGFMFQFFICFCSTERHVYLNRSHNASDCWNDSLRRSFHEEHQRIVLATQRRLDFISNLFLSDRYQEFIVLEFRMLFGHQLCRQVHRSKYDVHFGIWIVMCIFDTKERSARSFKFKPNL